MEFGVRRRVRYAGFLSRAHRGCKQDQGSATPLKPKNVVHDHFLKALLAGKLHESVGCR